MSLQSDFPVESVASSSHSTTKIRQEKWHLQHFHPEVLRNNLRKWVLTLISALKLSMPTNHTVPLPGGLGVTWGRVDRLWYIQTLTDYLLKASLGRGFSGGVLNAPASQPGNYYPPPP